MDKLEIIGLTVPTCIGVHAWEQKIKQKVVIDLSLPIDCNSVDDTLSNTLDYDKLCQSITHYLETNTFLLIETLAEKLSEQIKAMYGLSSLRLSVSKPNAIANASNVRVTIDR